MENSKFVTEWVIETVKEKYADDIALVVSHSTLRIDENEEVISYFVPITERGRTFARTFILDGEGFDIWGIEWERNIILPVWRMERCYMHGCLPISSGLRN